MVPRHDVPGDPRPLDHADAGIHYSGRGPGLIEEVPELDYSFDAVFVDGPADCVFAGLDQVPAPEVQPVLHRAPEGFVVRGVKISEDQALHGGYLPELVKRPRTRTIHLQSTRQARNSGILIARVWRSCL